MHVSHSRYIYNLFYISIYHQNYRALRNRERRNATVAPRLTEEEDDIEHLDWLQDQEMGQHVRAESEPLLGLAEDRFSVENAKKWIQGKFIGNACKYCLISGIYNDLNMDLPEEFK